MRDWDTTPEEDNSSVNLDLQEFRDNIFLTQTIFSNFDFDYQEDC